MGDSTQFKKEFRNKVLSKFSSKLKVYRSDL